MDVELARQAVRQLLRSIHAAIEDVSANASAARQQASAFPLADDAILAAIDSVESTKIAALETEAVSAEAVLEGLDDSTDDPTGIARVSTAVADASDLPTRPVEISHISLLESPSGHVLVAPRGIQAAHVELTVPPRFAQPGRSVPLRIALSTAYVSRSPEEMQIATAHLCLHLAMHATIETGTAFGSSSTGAGGSPLPVRYTVAPSEPGVVTALIDIPETVKDGARMLIRTMTFAGAPFATEVLPVRLRVSRGILVPMVVKHAAGDCSATPAISHTGLLVVPDCNTKESIAVFDADGASLAPLHPGKLGLSSSVRTAAFACPPGSASEVLYLCDSHSLLALDFERRSVLWKVDGAAADDLDMGLAPLPAHGVIIVSNYAGGCLHAHRLYDGLRVSTITTVGPGVSHTASDPSSSMVFVSARGTVLAYTWDAPGLVKCDRFAAGGLSGNFITVAVIPSTDAPGITQPACLVACAYGTSDLYVYELPSCRLLLKHTLADMRVVSLSAEPRGLALAVGDTATRSIHVLPWPLPSFPCDALAWTA